MSGYSTEMMFRIYDDDAGWYVEVRPDADALGGIELIYKDGDKTGGRLPSLPPECAKKVAEAILKLVVSYAEEPPGKENET